MIRRTSIMIAVLASLACSSRATEAVPAPQSADAFAGTWRAVTPSYEFIRLTVASKSSEIGALGARLTLSGVAWEGSGRITGDSLVMSMTTAGSSQPIGVIAVRAREGQTLSVQMRPASAAPLDLTFVPES
jgi:hypothetical protein